MIAELGLALLWMAAALACLSLVAGSLFLRVTGWLRNQPAQHCPHAGPDICETGRAILRPSSGRRASRRAF